MTGNKPNHPSETSRAWANAEALRDHSIPTTALGWLARGYEAGLKELDAEWGPFPGTANRGPFLGRVVAIGCDLDGLEDLRTQGKGYVAIACDVETIRKMPLFQDVEVREVGAQVDILPALKDGDS